MNLYQFATSATDAELHNWYQVEYTTRQQFELLHGINLYANPDHICRNCMTYDEARMLMLFVSLSTGEEWPLTLHEVADAIEDKGNV